MDDTTSFVDVGQQEKNDDRFELVDKPDPASVSLVIVGRAGVGKTALANAISKEVVGTESNGLDADSTEFLDYSTNRQGVDIKICDSPGLQGNLTQDDDNFLTRLQEKVNPCDVVIYCVRMDAVRLEKMDVENIKLISQSLGVDFWNKTVVALMFANLVTCPPSFQADDSSKENWLNQRAQDWQTELRSRLYEAGIPEDVADKIPLVPVGYNKPTLYFSNPWSIPCDKNWLLSFMLAVNRKLDNDPLGIIIDELRGFVPLPPGEIKDQGSYTGAIVNFMAGSASRIKVSAGVGAGIGAGVGVATGAMLSPVVAAAGGVAGAFGGATFVYTSLTAVAQKNGTHGP